MRKHFLLLLLMTLLPLAGWATDYEVQVTTYNGSAVWTGAKPAVQPGWFTAQIVGGSAVTGDAKTAIAAKLQVKDLTTTNPNYDAGAWDYQLELANASENVATSGGDNYTIFINSSTTATLTITQYKTAPTIVTTSLAYVTSTLTYDPTSEGQALLSGGATATTYNSISVPVIYALSAAPATEADIFTAYGDVKAINAGNYTVYYKVAETANYVGTNWTAIAGDAKNIAKADNTISDLALAGWTYDPVKTAEPLATGDNPAITFTATNGADAATFAYKKGTGAYGTWAEKVGGHAGSYTLKATIAESENYKAGEAEVAFTIAKATAVLTGAAEAINTDWTVYDGSTHQLFKQAATAYVGESQTPVTVKYTYKYCPPGGSYDASWATARTTITNSYLKKTDAGRYRLNISVEGNDDYNGASNKVGDAFPVLTVAQADIPTESYTAPAANTLMDTDADQPLITAGEWNDANVTYGTFKYSVDNINWGADVPVGNAAGGYTVYAKIDPTDAVNYKATVFDPIEVTIAAKTTVTIATNANQTFGYGTTPVIEKTVTWADQRGDALNEDALVWKWYTNSDCTTPATVDGNGNYAVGDYYVKAYGATVTGTTAASQEIVYTPALVKITAGQVTASISATAVYGGLPTYTLTHVSGLSPAEAENFNAANNLGVVTVKKGEDIILNGVANNSNDLKTLPQGTYTLEATASCGANYAVVVSAGTLTVSAKSIADAVITVTTAADDIVYNNKAWGTVNPIEFTVDEASGIEADDYDVTYSNNVNAGTATITLTGKRNYTGTKAQTFTIKRAALKITANNTNWTYGTTEPTYDVTVEGQAEGETALKVGGTLAGIDGTLTVVRTSNETVGLHADALVAKFGAAQPAASTNYNITYEAGDLTVGKAAATIQLKADVAATLKSEYGVSNAAAKALINAKLQAIGNYEVKSGITAAELASVNVGSVTCDLADQEYQVTESYSFGATGATSTNYDVAIDLEGVYFTVTPAPITLYANDQAIDWSDNDTTNDEPNTEVNNTTVAIATGGSGCGDLKYNDTEADVVATIVIESQNVGANNIKLTAKSNPNYTIKVNEDGLGNTKYGVLTVTGAPALTLSTADTDLAAKLTSYNGKAMPVTIDFAARSSRELPAGTARPWKAQTWVTMTLPFDISVADLSKALGYAIVNVIDPSRTTVDGTGSKFYGKLTMTGGNGKDDVLAANKPFMVKTVNAITGDVDFGTQTIVAPTDLSVAAGGGAFFTGTYTAKNVTSEDKAAIWFLLGNSDNWAYIKSTSSAEWNILPFEGFIDMSSVVNAPEGNMTFYFEELDGGTTAIKSISADDLNGKMAAEGMYNMNGMKLNTVPTQKGVYIMNGKKVVIK